MSDQFGSPAPQVTDEIPESCLKYWGQFIYLRAIMIDILMHERIDPARVCAALNVDMQQVMEIWRASGARSEEEFEERRCQLFETEPDPVTALRIQKLEHRLASSLSREGNLRRALEYATRALAAASEAMSSCPDGQQRSHSQPDATTLSGAVSGPRRARGTPTHGG